MSYKNKDKREGWLRDLKVGSDVIVECYHYGKTIRNVTNITPTGRISVENRSFSHRGEDIGVGIYEIPDKILQATSEVIGELGLEKLREQRERILTKFGATISLRESLSNEDLEKVVEILKTYTIAATKKGVNS